MDENRVNEIIKRVEKYKEWSKDMPKGELVSHKPTYKYIARDYREDVGYLLRAFLDVKSELKDMTEAHKLDLEKILELGRQVAGISDLEEVIGGLSVEVLRLKEQRDELGDSLTSHVPGVMHLYDYVPTGAREKDE